MSTRSLLSPLRLTITTAGLAVLIIAAILLLNWWTVSCGRLACDVRPAWAAEAATPDSCPPNLEAAATDPTWAHGILDNLPAWSADPKTSRKPKTTGWLFAEGVATETLTSGESGRTGPDQLWQEAARLLAGQSPHPQAPHPATSHVEPKAAVSMRQNKITYGVIVINNRQGPCGEEVVQPHVCTDAVRMILPVGSTIVIWWWSDRDGRMASATYEGAAT